MKNLTYGIIISGLIAGASYLNRNEQIKENDEVKTVQARNQKEKEKSWVSLEEARKNPEKRQAYLNWLLRTNQIPYCSGVIYDHDGSKIVEYVKAEVQLIEKNPKLEEIMHPYENAFKGGNYDAKTPEILELSGLNKKSKIFIGRKMFEEFGYLTEEDIKHIIVAHEGRHTEQHAKGLEYISKDRLLEAVHNNLIDNKVLYSIFEYDAIGYGLRRILSMEFPVSGFYSNMVKSDFINNGFFLTKSSINGSEFQRELIVEIHQRIGKEELRDVSVDPGFFEQKKQRFK